MLKTWVVFFCGLLKIEPGYPQLLRLLLIMKTCYSVIDIQRALNLSRDIWEIMDATDKILQRHVKRPSFGLLGHIFVPYLVHIIAIKTSKGRLKVGRVAI